MDGLAFYRLTQVPQAQTRKRKVVEPQLTPVIEEETGVEYNCHNCNKTNIIYSKTVIQCGHCDWRILEKAKSVAVTVNAV